jgi:hypothetical protein
MTTDRDLERRVADFYASEAPPRAPEWVVTAALATIDSTPQRRALVRVPWRFPIMNTYAKMAIAAVVVIAIGAFGLYVLRPGSAPSVGAPTVPSPSASPSQSPDPSAPPPLAQTFDSQINGISISYPNGWVTVPATESWTSMDQFNMGPAMDHVWDPVLRDHLSVNMASQPLNGKPGETWATEFLASPDFSVEEACGGTPEPITLDGASGLLCAGVAVAWTEDRGYVIWKYLSGDEPWLPQYYDDAWFRGILETVQLRPEDAVDVAPSAAPSAG